MPDYLVILLAMLAALCLNIMVWMVRDMERKDNEWNEIECWLNEGQQCNGRGESCIRPINKEK